MDWLIVMMIAAILGGAGWYVYRSRKKGIQCIGCPDAKTCSGHCGCCARGCGNGN